MSKLLTVALGVGIALPSTSPASAQDAQGDPVGLWAGGVRMPGDYVAVELRVQRLEAGLAARFAFPNRGFRQRAKVEFDDPSIELTVLDSDDTIDVQLRGKIKGDVITGRVKFRGRAQTRSFEFRRVRGLDKKAQSVFHGTYATRTGTRWKVRPLRRTLDEVLVIDAPGGSSRVLFPVADDEFVTGRSLESPHPIESRVRFGRDAEGRVSELVLTTGDETRKAQRTAEAPSTKPILAVPATTPGGVVGTMRAHAERREVTIDAGDVKLRGRLYFPPLAKRPCPAVVLVHGSGPITRSKQWFFYTSICLRVGLAVLAYDKRGCGDSTGEFTSFSVKGSAALFERLARDAGHAMRWLREQKGVDAKRCGFLGGSQAGWIMPLAAATTSARFVVHGCGPAVSAGEENHYSKLTQRMPVAKANAELEKWDGERGFDPRPGIARAKTPMLWIYGDLDRSLPTRASIEVLEEVRAKGNESHTIHLIRDCNHHFRNPDTGDGYMLEPVIAHWLKAIGVL